MKQKDAEVEIESLCDTTEADSTTRKSDVGVHDVVDRSRHFAVNAASIFLVISVFFLFILSVFSKKTRHGTPTTHHFAVSTTHFFATNAAADVLRRGGTAADAAAVAQFVLNVVQPQSTGIGGGSFVMHYNGEK